MAGSYDLLVPLMLAEGIAFVALRRRFLYDAQVPTHDDSPAHQRPSSVDLLATVRVEDLMTRQPTHTAFVPATPVSEIAHTMAQSSWQTVYPVVDGGAVVGAVGASSVGRLAPQPHAQALAVAADLMDVRALLQPGDTLRRAAELFLETDLRQLPVIGIDRQIVGFVDESSLTRAHLEALAQVLDRATASTAPPLDRAVERNDRP
jgi:chloride channel protein, CIC family